MSRSIAKWYESSFQRVNLFIIMISSNFSDKAILHIHKNLTYFEFCLIMHKCMSVCTYVCVKMIHIHNFQIHNGFINLLTYAKTNIRFYVCVFFCVLIWKGSNILHCKCSSSLPITHTYTLSPHIWNIFLPYIIIYVVCMH